MAACSAVRQQISEKNVVTKKKKQLKNRRSNYNNNNDFMENKSRGDFRCAWAW